MKLFFFIDIIDKFQDTKYDADIHISLQQILHFIMHVFYYQNFTEWFVVFT